MNRTFSRAGSYPLHSSDWPAPLTPLSRGAGEVGRGWFEDRPLPAPPETDVHVTAANPIRNPPHSGTSGRSRITASSVTVPWVQTDSKHPQLVRPMVCRCLFAIAYFLAATVPARADADADRAAITARLQHWAAAFNAHDAAGIDRKSVV